MQRGIYALLYGYRQRRHTLRTEVQKSSQGTVWGRISAGSFQTIRTLSALQDLIKRHSAFEASLSPWRTSSRKKGDLRLRNV